MLCPTQINENHVTMCASRTSRKSGHFKINPFRLSREAFAKVHCQIGLHDKCPFTRSNLSNACLFQVSDRKFNLVTQFGQFCTKIIWFAFNLTFSSEELTIDNRIITAILDSTNNEQIFYACINSVIMQLNTPIVGEALCIGLQNIHVST